MALLAKVTSRWLHFFLAAILVSLGGHQHGGSILGSVNFVQNISRNIWSLGKRKDLKLGEVSYLFISYNMIISWLITLNGFWIILWLCDSEAELPAFQPATLVFKCGRPPTEGVYAPQASIILLLLKQEEHKSFRSSCHFVPRDQNKLCAHDKNRKRAEVLTHL